MNNLTKRQAIFFKFMWNLYYPGSFTDLPTKNDKIPSVTIEGIQARLETLDDVLLLTQACFVEIEPFTLHIRCQSALGRTKTNSHMLFLFILPLRPEQPPVRFQQPSVRL